MGRFYANKIKKGVCMNLIDVDINKLIPYANNPRKNDGAVDAVAKSIEKFGFKVPIVIDSEITLYAVTQDLKPQRNLV